MPKRGPSMSNTSYFVLQVHKQGRLNVLEALQNLCTKEETIKCQKGPCTQYKQHIIGV